MSDYILLINLLKRYLVNDKISLNYHGIFDDTFTDKLISIIDHDVEKKTKKRMALLISESFQNIVRHGDNDLDEKTKSIFGIRAINCFAHIFSFNLVDANTKIFLENKLEEINKLNKEEIRIYYTEALEKGTFNNKGGAGLGLIEMARKSERPIQKDFKKLENDVFAFYMQVDLLLKETCDSPNPSPIPIQENELLHNIILKHNIIFLFKGDFSSEIINPMVNIMKQNTSEAGTTIGYKIFHSAVELMQNITKHAKEIAGRKEGIFSMNKTKEGYYLSTGNYNADFNVDILEYVGLLNSLDKSELNNRYNELILKNTKGDKDSNGLGLIDILRTSLVPIEIKIETDEIGHYITIGVHINV